MDYQSSTFIKPHEFIACVHHTVSDLQTWDRLPGVAEVAGGAPAGLDET